MRKLLMSAVLAGVTMLSPGLSPEARASHDWLSIGAVFRVGAAHIAFALGRPSYGYEPAYYYRYAEPIHYRGHSCSRSCFHDAGYTYHHESCPVVAAHFSHYRVDPHWAFDRYAPRYSGYDRYDGYNRGGGYGYDEYDRGYRDRYDDHDRYGHRSGYDRDDRYRGHDRYDRYDRNDRNDRYDRDRGHRGRGRGHRHYKGCGH
jgi:hypothetical protein